MGQMKFTKWHITAMILLILQLATGIGAIVEVALLHMLPDVYFYTIIIGIVLLFVIAANIFFVASKMKNKNAGKEKGIFITGIVISVLMTLISGIVGIYIGKLNHTVSSITNKTETSNVVGVYVLSDSLYQELEDVKEETFGITQQFDYENTKQTLDAIHHQLNTEVETIDYDMVTDMVDALYRGEVHVIVLNESYVAVLEEQEQYASFQDRTRQIYSFEIITNEDLTGDNTEEEQSNLPITKRPFVVYLSGNDTRNTSLQTGHSDLNILAIVNPVTHQILLLNTPRDFYIPTSKSSTGENDKLTHCGVYGMDCSMETLGNLYGTDVDYFAQVNFSGFETLIDDIGGVTIDIEKSFVSRFGYHFYEGEQQLNGEYALAFARERKAFASGDLARGQNQMKLIQAIIKKVKQEETILTHYSDILNDLEGMFATNLTSYESSQLVKFQLEEKVDWMIKSFSVTGTGASMTTYTMPNQRSYVMIPDEASVNHARNLIQKVINGGILIDKDLQIQE